MTEKNLDYQIDSLESDIQFEYKRVSNIEGEVKQMLENIKAMEDKLDEMYVQRHFINANKIQT